MRKIDPRRVRERQEMFGVVADVLMNLFFLSVLVLAVGLGTMIWLGTPNRIAETFALSTASVGAGSLIAGFVASIWS